MNKIFYFLLTVVLFFIPTLAFACSPAGATIVYVNGIETTQQEAGHDTTLLGKRFLEYGGSADVQIITGYNPTHLDGYGDEMESISQAFGVPISDYDLDTILTQIAPEVTTYKLLLVGHSQGTFYTNELYAYLVQNGIPPRSIAVYNIATPASSVAGGGTYLTSANDKLINEARVWDAEAGLPQPLPANILIPPQPGDAADIYGGHYFGSDYLAGAAARIVSDIIDALGKLTVPDPSNDSKACFKPPAPGFSYDVQKTVFSFADPTIEKIDAAAIDAKYTLASVNKNANDIIHTAISDAFFSIFPKPDAQNAGTAFSVEKALYGSSLSEADYEALLKGQNPEEVVEQPQPSRPQQPQAESTEQVPQMPVQNAPPESPKVTPVAPTPIPTSVGISPGYGGGGGVSASGRPAYIQDLPQTEGSDALQSQDDPQTIATSTVATSTAAAEATSTPLSFFVGSPANEATFSTTTVEFSGTTSPQAFVFAEYATTSITTAADQNGDWSLSLQLPVGTTTISLSAADSSGGFSATSTRTVGVFTPPAQSFAASPVTDSFDTGNVGWSNYADNWTTSPAATGTPPCYAGNCLSENVFNQQYENIRIGTPIETGSFVIYFRNNGYTGSFGVGVCTIATSTECQNYSRVGGEGSLIYSTINAYRDDLWHYIYFAFKDGPVDKEYCGLVDDDDPQDCSWQTSSISSGTAYAGVSFFTGNGLNPGSSFYWDQLGTAPLPPPQ